MDEKYDALYEFMQLTKLDNKDFIVGGSMAMNMLGYDIKPDDIDIHIRADKQQELINKKYLTIVDKKVVNKDYFIDASFANPKDGCIHWTEEEYWKYANSYPYVHATLDGSTPTITPIYHLNREGLIWFYMDICKAYGFYKYGVLNKWAHKLEILRNTQL